jgi:hypothetical protein
MHVSKLKLQKSTLIALVLAVVLFALSSFGREVFAAAW